MSHTIEVTQDNWSTVVLQSKLPVIVDFWAPWCRPCMQLGPVLEEIAAEYDGKAVIAKVNVDEQRSLAAVWQIMSIPALMFFHHGSKVAEMIGAGEKSSITSRLDELID